MDIFTTQRMFQQSILFIVQGFNYLQEPSAMTPASRLKVQPGERVLDLCAAPGGKASRT